jgi:Holliday junction resolvase RusA-like endonuclease
MTEPFIEIFAAIRAVPKARARFARIRGKVRLYTPKSTTTYEREIAIMAHLQMEHRAPLEVPCKLLLEATFVPPKSLSKAKRAEVFNKPCPIKKDGDNLLKAIKDALNGVVYVDDRFVTDSQVIKRYGNYDNLKVTVWEL